MNPPSIEGYELLGELGRGGMGTVHRARQMSTRREVALKILSRADGEGHARFMREIRMMIGLRHPNIVQFLDSGESPGAMYFAMELIRGRTLHAIHEDMGPLAPPRLVAILEQGLSALQCLHQNGILHRDLKPLNLMESDDRRIVLMDLGLASSQQMTMLTRTGALLGTPRYLAPEQISGERASPASDVYSLGVTLYQLATTVPPFGNGSLSDMASAILNHPLPALASVRPDVSPQLGEAIDSMVRKDPAARPTIDDLLKVTEVAKARPSIPVRRSRVSMPRTASGPITAPSTTSALRLFVGAGLGLALVGALAAGLVWTREIQPPVVASISAPVTEASPAPRFVLSEAIEKLDDVIDDLKPLVKRTKQGRADTVDTSSASERSHYQQGVERTFRLLGDFRETIERGKTADPRDPAWLEFEQIVAHLLNLLGDLDAGREGSPLNLPLERLRKSLAGLAATADFRGCFVRIASTRLTSLAQTGPEAESRRRAAYHDAYEILDQQDPAWKREVWAIHYRIDLLNRLLKQWERWEYIDADPEVIRESKLQARRMTFEMVRVIEEGFESLEPEAARGRDEAEQAVGVLVTTVRAVGPRIEDGSLDPAERERCCHLLQRMVGVVPTVRATKEREKLAKLLHEPTRLCAAASPAAR